MQDTGKILKKLDKIEQELVGIKRHLKQSRTPLQLGGIWSGHEITKDEIVESRESLFHRNKITDKR